MTGTEPAPETATDGPILHLVLAEAALERVPEPLWSHPAVAKPARTRGKSPGETLLDDTLHHSAMTAAAKKGTFDEKERRGRPDIVHIALLVALDSRLNHEGRLRVWVHTRNDEVIRVDPDVRIQRSQNRFYGLLEALFRDGQVPPAKSDPAKVFMAVEEGVTLPALVARLGVDRTVVLDEGGEDTPLDAAMCDGLDAGGATAVVVGAYPTGPFRTDLSSLTPTPTAVRLGSVPLNAWTVVSEATIRFYDATSDRS